MENDRLNEIRELNPDYDISMHELDVCVGDNQYRLMYYVYVQHKESGIGVYGDKDFDMQSINLQFNCNDIASSLKAQCNGLVKPECKEHISNEEACHAIDKMIEWYYQVEEPEFLKFYNCHLEMLE